MSTIDCHNQSSHFFYTFWLLYLYICLCSSKCNFRPSSRNGKHSRVLLGGWDMWGNHWKCPHDVNKGQMVTHLGAGHTYLWACIDMYPAVGTSRYAATHGVGDPHGECTTLLAVPQRIQGVCGLPCGRGNLTLRCWESAHLQKFKRELKNKIEIGLAVTGREQKCIRLS